MEVEVKAETTVVDPNEAKLFEQYSFKECEVKDICFMDYINVSNKDSQIYTPHTAGRWQKKKFRKLQSLHLPVRM